MTEFAPPPPPSPPLPPLQQEAPGATAGLVLGILSIALGCPVVGFILALIGWQKSREAKILCEANPGVFTNEGVAKAGYILCIIGLVLGAVSLVCGIGYFVLMVVAAMGATAG